MTILSRSQTKRVASMISASQGVSDRVHVPADHGEGSTSQ